MNTCLKHGQSYPSDSFCIYCGNPYKTITTSSLDQESGKEHTYKACPTGACPKVPHDGNCGCKCHQVKPMEECRESTPDKWEEELTFRLTHEFTPEYIKSFIRNLLYSQRQDLISVIEELIK